MKNEEKGKGKGLLFGTFVGKTIRSINAFLGITKAHEKLPEGTLLDQSGNILSNTKDKASAYIQTGTSEIHNVVKKNDDSVLDQSGKILNDTKNKAELYVETGTPEIRNKDGR